MGDRWRSYPRRASLHRYADYLRRGRHLANSWIEKAQPTIDAIVSCYRERTACLSNGRSAILHSAATAADQPQEPCNGLRRPRMSLRGIERRPYALRGLRCYAKGGGANRLTTSQSGTGVLATRRVSGTATPYIRKEMPQVKLSRDEFVRRYRGRFVDPGAAAIHGRA